MVLVLRFWGMLLIGYYNENEAKRAEMLPKINGLIENILGEFYAPLEKDVLTAQLNLYAAKASEYGFSSNDGIMKGK